MKISRNCMVTLRQHVGLADGTAIDDGAQPVTYVHGGYQDIFASIERELDGKSAGDRISVVLKPEETYGLVDESLRRVVPLDSFATPPRPGEQVESQSDDSVAVFLVQEVTEQGVVLDGNHPLAGLELIFNAEVLDVRPATPEEVARAAKAVHVAVSRWRAFKAAFTSVVAAPAMVLMGAGLAIEWLGSGILAYAALVFGLAVVAVLLWKGAHHLRDLWRGGTVLRIDSQGIQWRGFHGLAAWDDVAKVKLDTFGDDYRYVLTLADNRQFRIEAGTLSLDGPQISRLLAQYLPPAKLDGL